MSDAGWFTCLGIDNHDLGGMDRSFTFNNTTLRRLRRRFGVPLHKSDTLDNDTVKLGKDLQYFAALSAVIPRQNQHHIALAHEQPVAFDFFNAFDHRLNSLTTPPTPAKQSSCTSSHAIHGQPDRKCGCRSSPGFHQAAHRHSHRNGCKNRPSGGPPS